MTLLFPHDEIRPIQKDMVDAIVENLGKHHLVLHAPTGLGKTAASLAPTLTQALASGKTVFFLTSRNTQHKIAIDTVRSIVQKHDKKILATDIVGKQHMCIQPGVGAMKSGEFHEYCRTLREHKKCEFYDNLKKGEKNTPETEVALHELEQSGINTIEELLDIGKQYKLCPYELGMLVAAKANIIITDYYYIFHPTIRDTFFAKNKKRLEDSIIVVDEGHNLPYRIKDLASEQLSTLTLKRAVNEATKHSLKDVEELMKRLAHLLNSLIGEFDEEEHITRNKFYKAVQEIAEYTDVIQRCQKAADQIREEQKQSAIGAVGEFLEAWMGEEEGYTRIITRKKQTNEDLVSISYRCLDPSLIAAPVIKQSYATILMSGTLTPTPMYTKLLGFPQDTFQEEYPSPFPPENRLNLIVAQTSTKFTKRTIDEFEKIAKIITDIINVTPGNSIIFFPSYQMKDIIVGHMAGVEKTVFQEHKKMQQSEKDELIDKFRSYKKTGATLLAVVAGSFGEGVDLPGDELKTVVVVGLPLTKPDLETNALIDYYDKKFKNGWNYGYVYPAFNKIIQNAGRCIRSSTDKGVIVFLDERFTWPQYYRCFPQTWKMKVTVESYEDKIKKFFGKDVSKQAKLPF